MKKLITAIIFTAAALMAAAVPQALADDISVTVDGRFLEFDEPPRIINDRVMVPMRKIFAELGADIRWDDETKTATAVKDAQYVQFTQDSTYMLYGVCKDGLNSGELEYAASNILDSAPVIENDTMFIPVRAVSEAFYYSVEWHPDWNRVEIMTPPYGDGWIYYASWTDGGHMYRIDTNGRTRQLLSYNDCFLDWRFRYLNGYIYYSIREPENEGRLYRIRTDGMGEERLTDEPVEVLNDYDDESSSVYYIEGAPEYPYSYSYTGVLKAIDGKTGKITTLVEDNITDARLYRDYVYFRYSDAESIADYFSYYRVDAAGNIEQIIRDIPVSYFRIDYENEKLMVSSENGKIYSANLDGSNLEEIERPVSSYSKAYEYGLDHLIYEGEDFVIGENWNDEEAIYGINADKTERFKIAAPEGTSIGLVTYHEGKVYYSLYGGEYNSEKLYVASLDELRGMERISVGEDMVDGKYVIDTNDRRYTPSEIDGIYVINDDGTDNHKIVDKYALEYIHDDVMILYDRSSVYSYDWDSVGLYMADLDGGNLREFSEAEFYEYYNAYEEQKPENDIVDINEYVKYGIVVYNDGRVEPYYHPSRGKYN